MMSTFCRYVDGETPPSVYGDGLKGGTTDEPVIFTVDGRNAPQGELSCRCRGPSGKPTSVILYDNYDGTYKVDLNVVEYGLHSVEVDWDNQPITGSPFVVRIAPAKAEEKLLMYGRGLKSGISPIKKEDRLAVYGRGLKTGKIIPSKKEEKLEVYGIGLKSGKKPTKKEEKFAVFGQGFRPAAKTEEKVVVYGLGLKSGVIDLFCGVFHVDVVGDVAGQLKVQIEGRHKGFKVEKYRTHPEDHVINFKYNPTVTGIYMINVLWSNRHVKGSPFEVYVAPHVDELRKWHENPGKVRKELGYPIFSNRYNWRS